MAKKLNIPPEIILEWIKLYHLHEVPSTDIAKRYGVSVSTVYANFDALGIRRRYYGYKYMSSTPQVNKLKAHKSEVIRCYTIEMWNMTDVGKKFGVCNNTVSIALKAWGVPTRRSGPRTGNKRGPYLTRKTKTGKVLHTGQVLL